MNISRCFVMACLLAVSVSLAAQDSSPPQVPSISDEADYEKQLNALAKTIAKLQKELNSVKTSRGKLEASLQQSEIEASELTQKIEAIKAALAREKKQLSQYQRQRAELDLSRRQQQQQISQVVRQAYALGRQSQIKLLLNQQAPYRISRLLRYHRYIVDAQQQKLDDYLQTIAQLTALEEAIAETSTALQQKRDALNKRYVHLQNTQAKRLQTLTKLSAEVRDKDQQLSRLQSDRGQLQRLLEEASKALSELVLPQHDALPFKQARGKLPYPVKGRVINTYNSPKLGGKLRWKGIVVSADPGTEIIAVHHGRVIFSDYLRGHGLLLIIDHGGGYMSLYAHNQTLLKETGDWVHGGEAIATLGNTGGQLQAGLYFEIRLKGKTLNPQRWLQRG
ncbi:MAG: peptidoglycan DD-metalloendopeptidase family protein [Cellvibrionaceae bacterium]|nr:peptidoglycan DD-metalloendopeptidase family protein [Cellvibrionaceae bacterium]